MTISQRTYVAKIELATNTYYVTNRSDITLNSNTYYNLVRSFGDVGYYNNTLEGKYQISTMAIELINGEEFLGNGYVFSSTDVWNNYTCEVRIYDVGNVEFEQCIPIIKGRIKNFNIADNIFSFTVESIDERDDILLPTVVVSDNSGISGSTYVTVLGSSLSNKLQTTTSAASIFSRNELVILRYDTSYSETESRCPFEVAVIKEIDSNNEWITLKRDHDYINRITRIEKAFMNAPVNSINKTIPMQYGDLDDADNGVFGKTIATNELIGKQKILLDTTKLYDTDSIGTWDNGIRRFYRAQNGTLVTKVINNAFDENEPTTETQSTVEGEYEISGDFNEINFRAYSSCNLTNSMSAVAGTQQIDVDNAEYISFFRENTTESYNDNPESLFQNVLSVDGELLLLVDEPDTTSNTIIVERGFNNTTVASHASGAKIYQSSKYSSRNKLFFSERFTPKALSNYYFAQDYVGGDTFTQYRPDDSLYITDGKWSNVIDENTATYVKIYHINNNFINFNMIFEKIENDYSVIDAYVAYRYNYSGTGMVKIKLYLADPSQDSYYNDNYWISNSKATFCFDAETHVSGSYVSTGGDTYTTKTTGYIMIRQADIGLYGASKTQINRYEKYRFLWRVSPSPLYIIENPGIRFKMTSLKDLNNKWKFQVNIRKSEASTVGTSTIYNVGFWIDFIADYTRETIVAPLRGREITTEVNAITETTIGALCEHPVDVITNILIHELGYTTSDFGASWSKPPFFNFDENEDIDYAYEMSCLIYNGTTYVGCSGTGGPGGDGYIVYTTDPYGEWTTSSYASGGFLSIAYGDEYSRYVCIRGSTPTTVYSSSDLETFTYELAPNAPQQVRYKDGKYIIVGYHRYLWTSTNGLSWSTESNKLPAEFNLSYTTALDYVNDRYVAVAINGAVAYSTDNGGSWTYACTIPDDGNRGDRTYSGDKPTSYHKVSYGNGMYVVAKKYGPYSLAYSTDLTSFTLASQIFNAYLTFVDYYFYCRGLCFDGEKFVASVQYSTFNFGGILYSYDGIVWYYSSTTANVSYHYDILYDSTNNYILIGTRDISPETPRMIILDLNEAQQKVAMSYGVDDTREKGFDFVSKIANHFNMTLYKDYEGKLNIADMYANYYNTTIGYKIEIEEILFLAESGQRRIVIYQTGTDLIYNDVEVRYKRNNATNEYQAVYSVPESFLLRKSGISLKTARETYYSGRKRTLTIESPFIYNEYDAKKLAEMRINEFAEIHFYIELAIDFNHYSEVNLLSDQYKIGMIVYLNGTHGGITFDVDRKFIIQDVIIADNGRELHLNIKSVDPISEF